MSNLLLSESSTLSASRPASLTEHVSRRLLFRHLRQLSGGRLHITESGQSWDFGSATDELDCTLHVRNPRFYRRLLSGGSLGFAESYMDGDWTTEDLTRLIRLFIRQMNVADGLDRGLVRLAAAAARVRHWINDNTRSGSRRNIAAHYDLGNEFFQLFLDETMMYSSAVFESPAASLQEASEAKLDRICRKLNLGPADHVVEIGTGWGGFAVHAASRFGCRVTTTTISREQHELARARIEQAGLQERVTLLMEDYRDLQGQFDKLVSIEMIEAVGHKHLPGFFAKCSQLLKPHGMLLIQGITMAEQRYAHYLKSVDFIQRYIFPGGCLPTVMTMGQSIARHTDMRLLTLEDIAPHYARTLKEWQHRFQQRLGTVRQQGYSESFVRMWKYYLSYCEAAFVERSVGVCQLLAAKPGCRFDPVRGSEAAIA